MPQISKVRIVNFNYNDGKRLIADELYDFASNEKNEALNVLINLANGGGKSVLVQLMMQPIIPKAKVSGRKIESFFNKASDHCFVLLEWIKDNSKEKLMTGSIRNISDAIASMMKVFSNKTHGDCYYTLIECINTAIENSDRMIAKIMTDLKEFENNHNDLVRQCVLQGECIYEGLLQMASSSRVTVYNGKDKKQMIRFDIPAEVDSVVANASLADEIDKGTKELVARMSDENVTEVDVKKMAQKIVGSRNLLRKYIGKEEIHVDAYKIDQNPQNAGYRSWEKTQVNNSGAEKFVVYFAVILSLMNYTRGDFGGIRNKDLRGALILDNPFGATSSKHILVPMFAIAKHFNVQLICLSDINKSDVINCFDIVIKAIVKRRSMSNNELLTHEGNESIEHGFYRAEQLSLNFL